MFPTEPFGVKTNPAKSVRNLGVIFDTISPSTHTYQQSAANDFTIFWISGVFIRYLDLERAKLLATALVSGRLAYRNSLMYDIVDSDLTKLQCVQNWLARVMTESLPLARSVFVFFISLHWLPIKCRILFGLLTYKMLHEKQSVYLHSMLVASLPFCSLTSDKGISLSVPRVEINIDARAFHSYAPSLGTSRCRFVQPFQLLPSRNISRHTSDLASPCIDTSKPNVTERLHQFCSWTLIWLLCHRAWLCQEY